MHLYLELRGNSRSVEEVEELIHASLKKEDSDYRDLEVITGRKGLKLSLLEPGTFAAFTADRKAAGVEIAHLKPTHVNPKPEALDRLLKIAASRRQNKVEQ